MTTVPKNKVNWAPMVCRPIDILKGIKSSPCAEIPGTQTCNIQSSRNATSLE